MSETLPVLTALEFQDTKILSTELLLSTLVHMPMRLRHLWLYDETWRAVSIAIGNERAVPLGGVTARDSYVDLRPLQLPPIPSQVLVHVSITSDIPRLFTGGKVIAEVVR